MDFMQIKALLNEAAWPEWEPVRMIGKGSYGTVYEIQKRNPDGTVSRQALKVISIPEEGAALPMGQSGAALRAHYASVADTMEQEYDTMRMLMNRGCKNVVWCFGHKRVPNQDGIGLKLLIRMELLTDLNAYVRRNGISRQAVIRLGIDICRALEACWEAHVFHRDIKPANLFVSAEGVCKLGDFGVAKRLEETGYAGSKQGTILYMAPEVYKNMDYDGRADMYSLGLVMYQMMNNGQLPFVADRYDDKTQGEALARRMRGEKLPRPVGENGIVGKAICYACEPEYHNRYKSPTEMRMVLERLLDPNDRHVYLMPMDEPKSEIDERTVSQWGQSEHQTMAAIPRSVPGRKGSGKTGTATMSMDQRKAHKTGSPAAVKRPGDAKKTWMVFAIAALALIMVILVGLIIWKPWETAVKEDTNVEKSQSIQGKKPGITLNTKQLTMIVGQEETLAAEAENTKQPVVWTVEEQEIVSVEDGKITALKEGRTTVTATVGNASATCTVIVTDREVETIEIVEEKTKKEYFVGDTIADNDITLLVTYNNGETEEVSEDYTLSDVDFSQAGDVTITITYMEKDVSMTVTVQDDPVKSIEIATMPVDTDILEGETLNTAGLTIKVHFSSGKESVVEANNITCSPLSFSEGGTKKVTVTYVGQSTEFDVNVTETYRATAVSSNGNYGTVSVDKTGPYLKDDKITLKATPKEGCIFEKWSDGETKAERTVTASSDISYTAVFYGPESDWVKTASDGAKVVDEKYTYTLKTTTTSNSSTLNGWTYDKETWEWGEYGSWKESTTYIAETDAIKVEEETRTRWVDTSYTQHQYHYYHFCCKCAPSHLYTCNGATGHPAHSTGHDIWVNEKLPLWRHSGGMNYYEGPWCDSEQSKYWFIADGKWGSPYGEEERDIRIEQGKNEEYTVWKYKTREKIYTYHFYKTEEKEATSKPSGDGVSNVVKWVKYREK